MATEPKRQEPNIPPQKPDIQPEPRPEEIPQIRMSRSKKLRLLCSFSVDLRLHFLPLPLFRMGS
jgi:hypothetical protein